MVIKNPCLPILFGLAIMLVACGGGSKSRPASPVPPPQPMPTAQPDPMQSVMQKSQKNTRKKGTPSSEKAAKDALAKHRQSGGILSELSSRQDEQQNFCYFDIFLGRRFCPTLDNIVTPESADAPSIATTDTKAAEAWKLGWTGKGVKVAIVDDYKPRSQSLAHGVSTRGVVAQIAPEASFVSLQLNLPNNQDNLVVDAYTRAERAGAYIVNSSFGINPFRNGGSLTEKRVADELATVSFQKTMLPAASAASFDANMLFIFSAGNHARDCIDDHGIFPNFFSFKKNLSECSIEGRALLKFRETEKDAGDRAIFVGSLADESTDLADYSLAAGTLMNDYIVAHDDIYHRHDGRGTSFAAPRVTGAAALIRHKFPSLNGPKLKQVLLKSADDLGEKGPDEIYGHGKLNILSALSPIDGLTK